MARTATSRTAAAPFTPKGERTRQRIIATAAEVILRKGVFATTIEDVRLAAGVSSSQIYHYFADKQTLLYAVIDFQSDSIVGGQEPLLRQIDTVDGLRQWANLIVAHQRRVRCRGGCPLGSIGSEIAENDAAARKDVAAAMTRWEAALRTGFTAMLERGDLPSGTDADQLATATLATVQGALLLVELHRSTTPLQVALDMVIDHVQLLRDVAAAERA